MTVVVAKFLLSPLGVVLVSMAGRRWGMKAAGTLGSLPVIAGPILLTITLTNGASFGAAAATSTVFALSVLGVYVVVYALAAERTGPLQTLLIGWAVFLVGVAILNFLPQLPVPSLLLAWLSFWIGLKVLPVPSGPAAPPVTPPWWDLPLRGLAALSLVVVISGASATLGPQWSGLLTPFPIITCVLAVFTHVQGGSRHVIVLMRSFLVGFFSFASFCFTVAVSLDRMPIAPAFLLAVVVCLAVQGVAIKITGR